MRNARYNLIASFRKMPYIYLIVSRFKLFFKRNKFFKRILKEISKLKLTVFKERGKQQLKQQLFENNSFLPKKSFQNDSFENESFERFKLFFFRFFRRCFFCGFRCGFCDLLLDCLFCSRSFFHSCFCGRFCG